SPSQRSSAGRQSPSACPRNATRKLVSRYPEFLARRVPRCSFRLNPPAARSASLAHWPTSCAMPRRDRQKHDEPLAPRAQHLRVFALEEQLLILTFHRQCGLHGNLPAGLHRALDSSHSFGGLVRRTKLARVLQDVFHEAVAIEDVIDDAKLFRLLEGERVSRY